MKTAAWLKKILCALMVAVLLSSTVSALAVSSGQKFKVTASWLHVRKSGSMSAPILDSIKKGTKVTYLGKSGNWYKVSYGSSGVGYVYKTYLKKIDEKVSGTKYKVNTKKDPLNGRVGPGDTYKVGRSYKKGATVTIYKIKGKWGLTKEGYWVYMKYLKKK